MKLSDYARQVGVSYKTAWRWFRDGKLQGYQMDTGTIIVTEARSQPSPSPEEQVVIYSRVSAAENRPTLDAQAERLVSYCMARGYQVQQVVKEIGSGVNDHRPKLLAVLTNPSATVIVVEHKDRLTRFGFRYIESLLSLQGRRVEVVNHAENGREDLLDDLVAIIYSFCARLYGQRRARRKTDAVVAQLREHDGPGGEVGDATG